MKARLFTDGGARGNPGPAASAYVLEAEDGVTLEARGEAIGVATNNVAEYRALIAGLEKALELGVTELEVVSDSELLVKQMRGEYKVKNRGLMPLSIEAADSPAASDGCATRPCAASTTSLPTASSTRRSTPPSETGATSPGRRWARTAGSRRRARCGRRRGGPASG